MSEVILLLSSGTFVTGLFSYLRYLRYAKLLTHVIDKLGVEGLEAAGPITPPMRTLTTLPRRRRSPSTKPLTASGAIRAA